MVDKPTSESALIFSPIPITLSMLDAHVNEEMSDSLPAPVNLDVTKKTLE
jgi:hypothetical protein